MAAPPAMRSAPAPLPGKCARRASAPATFWSACASSRRSASSLGSIMARLYSSRAGRPRLLRQRPAHLAAREERARPRHLVHADAVGGAVELGLAPLRAEEILP